MEVKKGEIFNSIQVPQLPRNTFDLSYQHCTTINFSDLIPISVMEAVPGDIFNISSDTFIRLQPLITPMMHRCDFTVHWFFVPNRILWPGWEDFITGNNALGTGLSTPAAPYITPLGIQTNGAMGTIRGSLPNYMGMEVQSSLNLRDAGYGDLKINALPFAAYQKIYFDYYVPKELYTSEEFVELIDGSNDAAARITPLTRLRQKGWIRDYFTSALPYAQKGEQVLIPMEGLVTPTNEPGTSSSPGGWRVAATSTSTTAGQTGGIYIEPGQTRAQTVAGDPIFYDPQGSLKVENSVTTVNDLRRAIRLQEWLEKNARAGTRYTETLKVHFDVTSSDARLQRAEYITGIKSPIIVSEVLNTTGEADGLPQGNMAGHAIGIADGYGESFFCEEHGWIFGILSVTPRPTYSTGLPRFFVKRNDVLDYYWNEFANIGEQEIMQVELQADLGATPPDHVFGYTPRYAEYKFKNDMITGDFADAPDGDLGSLRTWVMQRKFDAISPANLNEQFITGDIKTVASSVFAVEDTPIMVQHLNKLKVSRLMPVYGTPTF